MQAYLGQFISSGTSILECKLPTSKVGSELIQPASLPKKRPPTWVLCQLRNNLVIPQIPHLEEGAEWSKHEAKPGWSILETCQGKAPLWSESHESGTIFGLLGVALAGLRIFKKVPENVTPGCLSSVLCAHMSHLFTQNIQLACEAVTPHHEMVATQLDGLVAGKSKEAFIVTCPFAQLCTIMLALYLEVHRLACLTDWRRIGAGEQTMWHVLTPCRSGESHKQGGYKN